MYEIVKIDINKVNAIRETYDETINSKSIYKIIGGNKMKSYKGYEIEKQKIDEIVEEYIEDVHQQYEKVETIISEVALEGYEEGFADGEDSIINTCIRLSEYDKDVLIGIFFDDSATEDNVKNPIKTILTLTNPDTINTKLDAFDKACEKNKKNVSEILEVMADANGKIHTVRIGEKKYDYEVKLIPQVRDAAERMNKYSGDELIDIFGYAGLGDYRFSQYLMDYSVNQINAKLDEYDSNRMKAEQARVSNEMLEKFAKCLAEGCSKEDIERMLREIVNI